MIDNKKKRGILKKLMYLYGSIANKTDKKYVKKVIDGVKSTGKFSEEDILNMNHLTRLYMDLSTDKCIVCGKKAKIFSGHLHYHHHEGDCDLSDRTSHITAGYCSMDCSDKADKNKTQHCIGCLGIYKEKYGKRWI